MMHLQERNPVRILKGALATAMALLRRSRASISEPGRSAEHAKFDTRKWTPGLLKHLDWRRFEELAAAYFEALGFTARVSPPRASGNVDIGLCPEGPASGRSWRAASPGTPTASASSRYASFAPR